MRSICFFASYFVTKDLPYEIEVYLKELKKHFSEVVLYTSKKELGAKSFEFLATANISLKVEENSGFDFGMWYKAFQSFDLSKYDQVALVNDSCILFRPLDEFMKWSLSSEANFKGMTASNAVAPHIQSYFVLLNKETIPYVSEYFKTHGILSDIKKVIQTYEIGLSSFLLSKGFKMAVYVDNNGYSGEYSPYYYCIDYHLDKGIPLIKKKILFASYREDELFTMARMNFNVSPDYYINKIKSVSKESLIDFSKLEQINSPVLSGFSRLKYEFNKNMIALVRKLRSPSTKSNV